MPQVVNCYRCGVALLLQDDAPLHLTCPKCLAIVVNPQASQAAPMRVLPVETDTRNDVHIVTIGLLALAATLIAGAYMCAAFLAAPVMSFALIMAGAVLGMIVLLVRAGRRAPVQTAPSTDPVPLPQDGVLAYQTMQAYQREPSVLVLPFLGGLFGSLGACAASFIVLLATLETSSTTRQLIGVTMICALAGLAVGSGYLGRKKGFSGVGRGVAIGLSLGMFALGPCAFCYMLV